MDTFKAYILVSVPEGESEPHLSASMARVCNLPLPQLRVGTLDSLLSLSDDLSRLDSSMTGVMSKVARAAAEIRGGASLPPVEVRPGMTVEPEAYVTDFQWSDTFPLRNKMQQIVQQIVKSIAEVDEGLRVETSEAQNVRNELSTILRKETGSLQSRSLFDVVRPEHVVDSEYLKTLFVFVPSFQKRLWEQTYETLAAQEIGPNQMLYVAVPRSAMELSSDQDGTLYRVVVLAKLADEFKRKCREGELRFTVREFEYTPELAAEAQGRRTELQEQKERMDTDMLEHTAGYFSQAFSNWVHLKVIRLYVESILRYSLPPRFRAYVIRTDKKNEKKVKQMLVKQYEHLGGLGFRDKDVESAASEGFLPFVTTTLVFH